MWPQRSFLIYPVVWFVCCWRNHGRVGLFVCSCPNHDGRFDSVVYFPRTLAALIPVGIEAPSTFSELLAPHHLARRLVLALHLLTLISVLHLFLDRAVIRHMLNWGTSGGTIRKARHHDACRIRADAAD